MVLFDTLVYNNRIKSAGTGCRIKKAGDRHHGYCGTVLMILLVDAHFELSMLLSVLMLLFAAESIAFGFYKNYKSFRIYGLILSMVSVFKLILFDVSNKSARCNAVGFLVCGLICFGISYLYNKIESRMKKK